MKTIQELIQESLNQFRGDLGEWSPQPVGDRELISRSFFVLFNLMFGMSGIEDVYPKLPCNFLDNIKEGSGLFIKGADVKSVNPSLMIGFPSGSIRLLQLGIGAQNMDRPEPDFVVKKKFSGSLSVSAKGRSSLEALRIIDTVESSIYTVLSDSLRALSVQITSITVSDGREDKAANDVPYWRFDSVLSMDIPNLTALFGLSPLYGVFQRLYIEDERVDG